MHPCKSCGTRAHSASSERIDPCDDSFLSFACHGPSRLATKTWHAATVLLCVVGSICPVVHELSCHGPFCQRLDGDAKGSNLTRHGTTKRPGNMASYRHYYNQLEQFTPLYSIYFVIPEKDHATLLTRSDPHLSDLQTSPCNATMQLHSSINCSFIWLSCVSSLVTSPGLLQ